MTWNVQRLKNLRAEYGMTQAEFATLLGVSTATVKYWETGGPIPLMASKFLDRIWKESPARKADLQSA
jgi:DNA-binding transcriptional regulator YiaG